MRAQVPRLGWMVILVLACHESGKADLAGSGGVAGSAAGGLSGAGGAVGAGGAAGVGMTSQSGGVGGGSTSPTITAVYPSGNPRGGFVLVDGTHLDEPLQVTVGAAVAPVVYADAGHVVVAVPDTAETGPQKLTVTPLSGKAAEFDGFRVLDDYAPNPTYPGADLTVPVIPPSGYIEPVSNFWRNEYADDLTPDARYFFGAEMGNGSPKTFRESEGHPWCIRGEHDLARHQISFRIWLKLADDLGTDEQRCPPPSDGGERFVGVYSRTASQTRHRLVLFPDSQAGGKQLVLRVGE